MDLKREERDGLIYWTPLGLDAKVPTADAQDKLVLEKQQKVLADKAEVRAPECWWWDCNKSADRWVTVVQFDLRHADARVDTAVVDTSDYDGPVPGFCWAHESHAADLARAVYESRPEMQWGFRPSRWFVIFTDGTKVGGETVSLAIPKAEAIVTDELLQSD